MAIEIHRSSILTYQVPFGLIDPDAIFVQKFNKTGIKFFSISDLKTIPGHLFAAIDIDLLKTAPLMPITYFKISNGVDYYYCIESYQNPLCLVVQRDYLVKEKIRITQIDRESIEFEINENGFPPLCRLEQGAEEYLIGFDCPYMP